VQIRPFQLLLREKPFQVAQLLFSRFSNAGRDSLSKLGVLLQVTGFIVRQKASNRLGC
jgi:hypothetical protein